MEGGQDGNLFHFLAHCDIIGIMVELVKGNFNRRVFFPQGKQRLFLESVVIKLSYSWQLFSEIIHVHPRTLNDWRREKYSLPLEIYKKIILITKIKEPKNVDIRNANWFVKESAKKGGNATFRKYGFVGGKPEKRLKKWKEWWVRSGQYNPKGYFVTRPIAKPQQGKELAEFVGIMLGDGGITSRQVTVSLNSIADHKYITFVKVLLEKLFGVSPAIYPKKGESVTDIVISRKRLVEYCVGLGLKRGNKIAQGVDIPIWINKDKELQVSCVRGLWDTDGCIFQECHKIKNKTYCYPRLSFVSHSEPLRNSVYKILKKLDFSPKIRDNRSVQLERKEDIKRYFVVIGSHNQKHIERYKNFGGVG